MEREEPYYITDDAFEEIVNHMSQPEKLLSTSKIFRELPWYIRLLLTQPFTNEDRKSYAQLHIPYARCYYYKGGGFDGNIYSFHSNGNRYLSWSYGYEIYDGPNGSITVDSDEIIEGTRVVIDIDNNGPEDTRYTFADIFTRKGQYEQRSHQLSLDETVSRRIINQLVKKEFDEKIANFDTDLSLYYYLVTCCEMGNIPHSLVTVAGEYATEEEFMSSVEELVIQQIPDMIRKIHKKLEYPYLFL